MAEKKFFVDINLQGNKLVNPVVGSNGSMTTPGSFQYNAGRLEYYNGSTVEEVANLNDIAAVTGGLILQGGYDAATNTPDIAADSSVLKGFFWVVTAAGSFLGEAVQVGDSIIAKQDNPGATAANWLILQGNVVIATDSVDGISRLATQAEADAGTEGGAVVITPATLQGKIDAQITPEINNKLPLAGGTMSGAINMGNYNINNVNGINLSGDGDVNFEGTRLRNLGTPLNGEDATNKTYVDNQDALKVSKSGDTMSGNLNMGANQITNADLVQTNSVQTEYLNTDNLGGNTTEINLLTNIISNGQKTIQNLPAPSNGGDAANKTYVDTKLPLAGGTMSGAIDMGNNDLNNVQYVSATGVAADQLISTTTPNIALGSNLDADNAQTIINLPAPTNGGDATNKTYVDGVGATAESNANAYTDTAISATSFGVTITTSDWNGTALNGYYFTINHGLNSSYLTYSLFDVANNQYVEADVQKVSLNSSEINVNNLPTNDLIVSFVKSGGNL